MPMARDSSWTASYTPQMVINGAEQIVGSDRAALAQAVQKEEEQKPRMSLRILSLSVARRQIDGEIFRRRRGAG